MNTLKKGLVFAALLAALGLGVYEAYQASQLRQRVHVLGQLQEQLTNQVARLQQEKAEVIRWQAGLAVERGQTNHQINELLRLRGEVTRLRNDSDELARLKTAPEKEPKAPPQLSAGPWIKRLNQLQQYLEQHPGEVIPEMQFAEMSAWLNSVQSDLETEESFRNAAFKFRNQAQMKFTGFIGEALRQFEQANEGRFPADLSQLLPYADPGVGRTLTDLYEIVPRSAVKDPAFDGVGDWIITRKATVNPGSTLDRHLAVVSDGRRIWYQY